MQRRKILWLTSWYPNANDAFDGDFIQRHARAAALEHDIHVLFVTEAVKTTPGETIHRATGLTEQIIYLPPVTGLFSRVRKALRWKTRFQQAVSGYIGQQGRPDLVHVHIPWKAGLIALWAKQKYKLPYIVSEHWGFYTEPQIKNAGWTRALLTRIYTEAAEVVAVSRYLSGLIEQTTHRAAGRLLPNVVDTSLFFYRPGKYDRFTFIHVSNMMPVKQVGGLLEAFARLVRNENSSKAQLILVGNRDEVYVEQARRLGLLQVSVFFRGELPYAEVAEEMRRAHALVLFSQSETFSCVTAEALCCGLPVVATAAGALPELVDETNGLLVSPGDVQSLTTGLRDMMTGYTRFDGPAIAQTAARKWGYTPVSAAFNELYTRVIAAPGQ